MPGLTIKNMPDDLYQSLKARAKANHRSLNGEAIACLERTIGTRRIDPDEFLARIRKLREEVKCPPLTERFLREAKNWGRP